MMDEPIEIQPETEIQAIAKVPREHALAIERDPETVLKEAKKAAIALKKVIDAKPRKIILNKKTYLEYEDWLTVGRFYGVTARVASTSFVEYGDVKGFEATAEALLVSTDQVISRADAMCLDDEENWGYRKKYAWKNQNGKAIKEVVGEEKVPLFQLRSMAQTRACAKALRNVLAWVVVLAGYAPTPAEEMQSSSDERAEGSAETQKEVLDSKLDKINKTGKRISDAQRKRLFAIAHETGWKDEEIHTLLKTRFKIEHTSEIPVARYDEIIKAIEVPARPEEVDPETGERLPF